MPFYPQELHQCGPAALATVLGASGASTDPLELAAQVYVPGRRGSFQAELIAATRRAGRVPWQVDGSLEALAAEIASGRPVLVLQNLALPSWPRWHYAVVIGVDADAVTLRSGKRRSQRMSRRAFLRSWQWAGAWGFVALRPGEWPASPDARRWIATMSDLETVGQARIAVDGLEAATRRWPGDPLGWFALGNARYRAAERIAARDAWRRSTDLAAGFVPAWNNLAQVLGELGCRDAALRALEHARALPLDAAQRKTLQATEAGLATRPQPASSTASACSSDSGTP